MDYIYKILFWGIVLFASWVLGVISSGVVFDKARKARKKFEQFISNSKTLVTADKVFLQHEFSTWLMNEEDRADEAIAKFLSSAQSIAVADKENLKKEFDEFLTKI